MGELYTHNHANHTPVNPNEVQQQERVGFNERIAVMLTSAVGTMWCAYFFLILAILGFPGNNATPQQYVQWVSQTCIQLVMLSVIMVGQKVIGRLQELQADETYKTTLKLYHEFDQLGNHLDAQDHVIVEIAHSDLKLDQESLALLQEIHSCLIQSDQPSFSLDSTQNLGVSTTSYTLPSSQEVSE
jgi:hypothetical protein